MSTRLDGSQEDVGQDDPATPLPHASDVRIETGLNFSSMDRLKIIQTRLERTVFDAENGIEKAIVETLHSVGSSPSSLVMNENDDTPSFGIMDTSPTFSKISNMLALAGAATLSSWIVGEMLLNFEWFQAWRYFWPLVGAVFVFDGLYPHVGTVSPAANAIGGAIGNGTRRRWISPAPSQRQSLSSPSSSPSRTGTQNAASSPLSMQQYLPSQVFGSKSAGANTSNMTWLQWIAFVVGGAGLLVGGAYDAWMPIWETGPNVITSAGIGHDSAMLLLAAVLSMTASSSNDPNDAFNKKRVDTTAAALSGDGYDGTVDEFSFDPMDTKDQANVRDASAIITNRGIGIDNKRATILDSVDSDHRTQTFWLQVLLVTELYKLSESAIDEVVTKGLDLVT